MQKYDKADAIAILGSYHHGMADIRDDGVWPSAAFVEGNVLDELRWNYASELDWPGSPNPLSAPSLPIPFSANELAAFMLAGIGVTIPVTYLDWNQGLDEDMLLRMGINAKRPKEALWAAYSLLRDAEVVVGEHPKDLENRVELLAKKIDIRNGEANEREGVFAIGISKEEARLRRAKAVKSLSALERSHAEAKENYRVKFTEWRRAMVRHLVRSPIQAQNSAQPRPTITLPAGTRTVDVVDIPSLIAETLYCGLLAEGRLPEGETALPDDAYERLRSVQLYKLTQTHLKWMINSVKTSRLVPISRTTRLPCGIDDIADAYVGIDAFKAYVGHAYDDIEVRVADEEPPPSTSTPNGSTNDKIKRRRKHYLHDLFMSEYGKCAGTGDWGALWARLLAIAKAPGKNSQLIGVTEKGLQFNNAQDGPREFSKKQLIAYMTGTNLVDKKRVSRIGTKSV